MRCFGGWVLTVAEKTVISRLVQADTLPPTLLISPS